MRQEVSTIRTKEFMNTQLKRSLLLSRQHERLKVEPDSTLSYLYSSRVQRILFGRGMLEPFRVQAGILISARQKEMKVRLSPTAVEFSSTPQEPVQLSQTLQPTDGRLEGYTRRVRVTNRSDGSLRLRVLSCHDPTSINFRSERDPPGEIGINAFNRGDHVVMDDVGDSSGARVIGFSPQPSIVYMTKDRRRALELLGSGELPDKTAGMSGALIIMAQHDAELPPGRSFDLSIVSLYHESSLGEVLSEFPAHLSASPGATTVTNSNPPIVPTTGKDSDGVMGCSNPSIAFAFEWGRAALGSIECESDLSERLFAGFAPGVFRPSRFEEEFESIKRTLRRDGLVPRTAEMGGPLETSMFVISACAYLHLKADPRLARRWYSSLKKAGGALAKSAASDGLIHASAVLPDGWRRRLRSGFPSGATSEVNLVAARALKDLAALAYWLAKGKDSAFFSETSIKIIGLVDERLRDTKTGNLALNMDQKGRLHLELTVDQAVALSLNPYDHGLASSLVHRLLEKDFESGYGPRCIPTSNPLYYSPTYGDGQLGSCWTRGALAHSILAYRSGYPSIGGMQLEKVARLVHLDWQALGGAPGEFPYWFDAEKRCAMGSGSDPVAAALFVQAVVLGELGLTFTPDGVKLNPPENSRLRWVLAHNLNLGERGSVFIGRPKRGVWVASSFQRIRTTSSEFRSSELVEVGPLQVIAFWNKSSVVVCAGNQGSAAWEGTVSIPVKGKPLASSLFADVAELNQENSNWEKVERRRLRDDIELRLTIGSSAWQAFKCSKV